MPSIHRWAAQTLKKGLSFQRAVLVVGPRQCGKTTLVREQGPLGAIYTTMDDELSLLSAQGDPHFFIKQGEKTCLVIDEIQKCPSLIAEVKRQVDNDNQPGQFILTGSADYRKLPTAEKADSLAGRVVIVRLRTLSKAESLGCVPNFLENAFDQKFPHPHTLEPCSRQSIYELAIRGGYPQALSFDAEQRAMFFSSYIESQVRYDLTKTWDLRRYKELEHLLAILAIYSSKPQNIQEICRKIAGNAATINDYINALQSMYLIDELPAWESKDYKLGSKTPELFLSDSALMAYLLNIFSPQDLLKSQEKMANEGGKLVETWAYTQLMPEVDLHPLWKMYHFRNKNKQEIDFLICNEKNQYLGIEIKGAESVNRNDFKHLEWFAKQVPHFVGIVLYAGSRLLSVGNGLYAVPFSALWANKNS